jgi:hypothetical protein
VYVRDWHPPGPYLEEAPGHWRYEEGWPIDRIRQRTFFPSANRSLSESAPVAAAEGSCATSRRAESRQGGPGHVVRGRGAGPASDGRLQPRLTRRDPFGDARDPGAPAGASPGLRGRAAGRLVRPRQRRRSPTAPSRSWRAPDRTERTASRRASRKRSSPARGFPSTSSSTSPPGSFRRGTGSASRVGNAQWPMIWPTPYSMTTTLYLGPDGTRLVLPVVPAGERPAPDFRPIEKSNDKLPGYESLDTGTTSGYGEISSVDRNPQTAPRRSSRRTRARPATRGARSATRNRSPTRPRTASPRRRRCEGSTRRR